MYACLYSARLRLSALALQHASTDSTWQLDSPLLLPPSYRQSDTPNRSAPMALLSSILGFSLFGLGARIGQLGIQKRNLLESAFLPLLAFHQSSHISPKISFLTFFHPFFFFFVSCFARLFSSLSENRPRRTHHLYARFWLSRLLGASMGRTRSGAHRRETCGDRGAAYAEDRAGRGGVCRCAGRGLISVSHRAWSPHLTCPLLTA